MDGGSDLYGRKPVKREKIDFDMEALPEDVRRLIRDGDIYDSSCSPEARVCYIDRDGGLFLKIAEPESLGAEAEMTAYFHKLGLSSEVLLYRSLPDHDYMISRRIWGEDCTYGAYLEDPKRLCDTTAGLLRELHEIRPKDCRESEKHDSLIYAANGEATDGGFEPELFKDIWEFSSFEETKKVALEGVSELKKEVLIHGDYCLPNIILKDWKLSGYIDLGYAGLGDRHIDILWGIWTLNFNLKTTAFTQRFMDAYGRDKIEWEKLRRIAAMEIFS